VKDNTVKLKTFINDHFLNLKVMLRHHARSLSLAQYQGNWKNNSFIERPKYAIIDNV